jgi:tripartite-type tricarboxylate transporter receptor subunit TctC
MALGGAWALMSSTAWAQSPATPIRMLVGFPTGGGVDPLARIVSDALATRLSTPIIVDNRPGAGGAIAAQLLKNAPADGKTLMFTMDHQIAVAPYTMKNAGYDPEKDFKPVAEVAVYDLCFGVNPTTQAKTLNEFIEESKKSPNGRNVAIPAPGSAPQFLISLLNRQAGAKFNPVPYRGGGPAMVDLLGGQVPSSIQPCRDFMEHGAKGNLRVLAAARSNRLPWAPDVPTLAESGFTIDTNFWMGIYAPANLPQARLDEIQTALADVMTKPEVLQRIHTLGFDEVVRMSNDFSRVVQSSIDYWKKAIQDSGYKPE